MQKYRKKPVEVEAIRFEPKPSYMPGDMFIQWPVHRDEKGSYIQIETPEGVMEARPGDYIIRGVEGEFYPCKASVFNKTYEDADSKEEPLTFELKEDFEIIDEGTRYHLPVYRVVDGKGIERVTDDEVTIDFVRGSKLAGEDVTRQSGTLHEHLLAVMIHDLNYKNGLVPSREGSLVITKLQEALGWLRQRQVDRARRGVVGTYKK